jgi:hypothetical protein
LLRHAALRLLAEGKAEAAAEVAGRAAGLDRLDEAAQELFLRTLVAAGHPARAAVHAARQQPDLVVPLARRLYQEALRADLPEFTAWALIYQAEAGDTDQLPLAQAVASQVVNPALQERAAALS